MACKQTEMKTIKVTRRLLALLPAFMIAMLPVVTWFSKNGKTGPSWSITAGSSCPGKTAACIAECYTKYGRQALDIVSRAKDIRFDWLKLYLKKPLFLIAMIRAMLAVKNIKTLRIHDSGDFFNPIYTRVWTAVCKGTPQIEYWAYTRSHVIPGILKELIALASLSNVALWLSADKDNYLQTMAIYNSHPGVFAGISFMQTSDSEEIAIMLAQRLPEKNFVNFPVHKDFGRVTVDRIDVPNCPAITREIPHDDKLPACLACRKCLPSAA